MKYLSVIIPFYNSTATLEKAAMSCLDSRVLNDIEVIMVNDGSKDNSLEVARSIEQKYPNSVRVIDKPNGGKGSCMNVGIKNATGKYLRELDSDDYFADGSIVEFISKIKSLQTDVDAIHTDYLFVYLQTGEKEIVKVADLKNCEVIDLMTQVLPNLSYQNYTMHSLTYRTDFLHQISFVQSEGISYTDTEYIYYPLTVTSTMVAFNLVLYCYCVGLEGQTVSITSKIKKQNHFWQLLDKYLADKKFLNGNASASIVRSNILLAMIRPIMDVYLYHSSYSDITERRLRNVMAQIKETAPMAYASILKYGQKGVVCPVKLWLKAGRLFFYIRSLKRRFS